MTKTFKPAQPYEEGTAPHIDMQDVESKKVKSMGYDPKTQTMAITFVHGVGAIYQYPNVRPEAFDAAKAAPSVGTAVGDLIKDLPFKKYRCEQATA